MGTRKYASEADRIRTNVAINADGCWVWQGRINRGGYGFGNRYVDGGRAMFRAHRLSYETFRGPIPSGLSLDHLCRNRACCNPEHLEAVTQRENLRRSPHTVSARNAAKTHCAQGHPFDEANTRHYAGRRFCRACNRDRTKSPAA